MFAMLVSKVQGMYVPVFSMHMYVPVRRISYSSVSSATAFLRMSLLQLCIRPVINAEKQLTYKSWPFAAPHIKKFCSIQLFFEESLKSNLNI
jgi:hypothetical protein